MDHIDLSNKNVITLFCVMFLVITLDAKHVFRGYDYARQSGTKLFGFIPLPKPSADEPVTRRDFLINHLSLIAMGIPVLLAEFPGFFVYDAQEELNEVLTRTFSTHHPLLHVLLLGGIIALVHKICGSWNAGIFVYILLQLIIMTAVFAYAITCLQKRGTGRKLRILFLVFYGMFPTIVMYSLCSRKDGLFSALLLLLTVFLIELVKDRDAFVSDKKKVALFVACAVLMPLFRHNGFYAYLVFVPFALIYFRKSLSRVLVIMLILPVVLYLAVSAVLAGAFSSEGTHHQETLTVPIMQLARVYTYEGDSIAQCLRATIHQKNGELQEFLMNIQEAAEDRCTLAQHLYGRILYYGENSLPGIRDRQKGLEMLIESAKENYLPSLRILKRIMDKDPAAVIPAELMPALELYNKKYD